MTNSSQATPKRAMNISLAYQGFVEEPVPSELFDAIVSGKMHRVLSWVKSILLLGLGALVALLILHTYNKQEFKKNTIIAAHMALSAHNTFAQDAVYPVHVDAKDTGHLTNWLSYRMGKQLSIKNIEHIGYTLLGANIVPDEHLTSASVIYEDNEKTRVSVFTRFATLENPERMVTQGTDNKLNWIARYSLDDQVVIVGELEHTELDKVFNELMTQL